MSDFQNFDKFRSHEKGQASMTAWKKPLQVLGIIALAIVFFAGCGWMFSGGSSAESEPSRGHAEVTCERAIENAVGKVKNVSYTRETDLGSGKFALYGTVFSDSHGQLKFHCDVKDAMTKGKTNGSATVELGK